MCTYTRTEQYDGIEMMAKLYESKVWNHARLRLRGGGMIEQIKINFIAGHCLLTCKRSNCVNTLHLYCFLLVEVGNIIACYSCNDNQSARLRV